MKSWAFTPDLDEAGFRWLAKARLLEVPAPADAAGASDFDLNPSARPAAPQKLRAAAVLVPVLTGGALRVLLTERTAHLPAHAGQIAFPGGKIEASDASPLAAALRETEEETGLSREFIEPLGYVEPYVTSTRFIVTPVVAAVRPGFVLNPDTSEVAHMFEVPLAFLLDEKNHKIEQRMWRGAMRSFYAMPYGQHYIWGATAGIIRALFGRLSTP